MPKKIVHPQDGGCWFCHTDKGDMLFDSEFDTNVHANCIRRVLEEDGQHPEARIMSYLVPDVKLDPEVEYPEPPEDFFFPKE